MASPEGWTFRVGLNLCSSWWRRRSAERRAERRLPSLDTWPGTDSTETDSTDKIAIRAALIKLPHRQRQAVILRYYADVSIADTAKIMGCAPGTVKALTAKATLRLRDWIEVQEPEEGAQTWQT